VGGVVKKFVIDIEVLTKWALILGPVMMLDRIELSEDPLTFRTSDCTELTSILLRIGVY
jgi:hypothetical protein